LRRQSTRANAKLRYQITSGNKGGAFDIEPEVGTIFIAQSLDYEKQKRYKLLVLASDGKWEDYAAVVVTIVNKNDEAPVFSMNEYYGSVTEELDGSPVFVLQVTATDPDKDADQGAIRYSIHGQGAESHFMINDITGEMYAQRTMDREERAVWRFVVMATDEEGEGLTGFTDVIINVWDINDNAPIFVCAPDNCHSSVAENSPPGTFVLEMTAVDLDDAAVGQNAILTYRITENAQNLDNANLFTIDYSTGTISVAAEGLDRELADSHHLVVEARDGGSMTGTATVTVVVTDINDHVPKFKEDWCGARIPESRLEDSSILELSAVDPDDSRHGQLAFSVVEGDAEQRFYIVSHKLEQKGTLRLKKKLDFEHPDEKRFNLTIRVEDSNFSSHILCMIIVEDENDNAPVFTPSSHLLSPVPEDVPVGTSIIQVVATDSDSGPNGDVFYSILPHSDPYGHFTVNRGGVVTVTNSLDRETVAGYELVVMATDHGTPALTGSVTVHLPLLDMNDNGPELEMLYSPVLWENSPPPQVVWLNGSSTLLHVVDRDSPEHGPPFLISLPSVYSADFHLQDHGNGSATVTALRRFDRERQSKYHLPVVMIDSGLPPITATSTLTITIGDHNDNAHQAGEKDVYVHSRKGKVYSPDPDDWDNKTYSLETTAAKYFSVNHSSGVLTVRQNTPAGSYWLRVGVSDGVWPDVMSGVRVHIRELEEKAILSSASLRLTVKVTSSALCGCAAREMTHRTCSSYPTNPCLNGGTCINMQNGYRGPGGWTGSWPRLPEFGQCQCPPQLEGPDCQQTRLSFLGNGYAWFPPIRPCFDSHLSLEFMTEEDDGLLLYAGPLATLLPGDNEDYIAIGK
ncbi:hypothetical protein GOODEAATRI_015008, partial [Goodea atripinnis]